MTGLLVMWVVYDHPLDCPDSLIARRFEGVTPTSETIVDTDLTALRHKIRRADPNLIRFTRAVDDDPVIMEVWL